ncbi:AraC family transcriptional regulator [Neomegalonema sp.]|uniref:AraC family transcriptional regulator n=1 Tax=Neomegalonema sp. TaxID=2039713 RepID=UPI002634AB46|nr:AraC family transcriptional regulator [Neomegalonema sp.]MDD2868465.1 AraC family transcriptional regulator [Neomegalonema sp.]
MSFRPRMTAIIDGVSARLPLKWRALDGIVADLWHAEGRAGGGGYYLSPDPRLVVFFDDVSRSMRLADRPDGFDAAGPHARIIYVPAGMPLWSRLAEDCRFSHLDLHFDARALERRLSRSLGAAAASEAVRRPSMQDESAPVEALARLLAAEVAQPAQHDLFPESLVQAILAALMASPAEPATQGGLTAAQLRRLRAHMAQNLHRRVPTAELAQLAGLSESWFAHAFKQATGETPLQWRIRLRVERAQEALRDPALSLAEAAALTGFADQAHLTRAFRAQTGRTPGAWRRDETRA